MTQKVILKGSYSRYCLKEKRDEAYVNFLYGCLYINNSVQIVTNFIVEKSIYVTAWNYVFPLIMKLLVVVVIKKGTALVATEPLGS